MNMKYVDQVGILEPALYEYLGYLFCWEYDTSPDTLKDEDRWDAWIDGIRTNYSGVIDSTFKALYLAQEKQSGKTMYSALWEMGRHHDLVLYIAGFLVRVAHKGLYKHVGIDFDKSAVAIRLLYIDPGLFNNYKYLYGETDLDIGGWVLEPVWDDWGLVRDDGFV